MELCFRRHYNKYRTWPLSQFSNNLLYGELMYRKHLVKANEILELCVIDYSRRIQVRDK